MSGERRRKKLADPRETDNIDDGNAGTEGYAPIPQRKKQRLQEFKKDEQSVVDLLPLEQLRNELLQQLQTVLQPLEKSEKNPTPSSQLKNTTEQTETFPRKDGLSIGWRVPEKIKQVIRETKYVDLVKLMSSNTLDEEGEVILYELMRTKRATEAIKMRHEIDGITAWVDAFTVYMAIYLEAHPQNAACMAEYINNMVVWSKLFQWDAVYNYDKDLRRKREKIPETSWISLDLELFTEMRRHYKVPSPPPYDPNEECRQYNGGSCRRPACRWAHKCVNCGKMGHPVVECWYLKSTSN